MGFNVGKAFSNAGKSVKKGFNNTGNFVEKNVGHVYSDVSGAVSYTGKHVIGDVDNMSNAVSSALSSPLTYIAIAVVGVVILTKM